MKRESEDSTMKRTKLKNLTGLLAAATAAALVAFGSMGCQSNIKGPHPHHDILDEANSDHFPNKEPEQTVQRFADVQTSNGARFDANLYPHDFNGAHLNSLGRAKVLLMLQDCETCEPIVIHLVDAGEGDLLDQRKQAVELYLKTAEGVNERTLHAAEPSITRLVKIESGSLSEGGTAPATDTTSMMTSTTPPK
jgi:hypothetical protein